MSTTSQRENRLRATIHDPRATWRAIGLMSGTSMDGMDAAIIVTDGETVKETGTSLTLPYDDALRQTLLALHQGTTGVVDVLSIENAVTRAHAGAVKAVLEQAQLQPSDIDVIGFHGQTIAHHPHKGTTWQLGNGSLLAELTGIDVVCDFRRRDMAANGQGAPLVPVFHAAIAKAVETYPLVVVNIGGISNVTWIGADGSLLAFDTGPGNALLDDWVRTLTGKDYDKGGALSSAGAVHEELLDSFLKDPYFVETPPKSLDRNHFNRYMLQGISLEDGAATLAAFTAHAIAESRRHFPAQPALWLVTGGGRYNEAIMARLAELVEADVKPVDDMGWNGDALEAQAFGFLAVRSLRGLPLTFPTTTGVERPVSGGALYRV